MLTDRLTEDLDHEIGEAIDDFWLISESRSGVDHAEDLHDPLYPVEASQRGPRRGEKVQPCRTGSLIALLERKILAHFPPGRGLTGQGSFARAGLSGCPCDR